MTLSLALGDGELLGLSVAEGLGEALGVSVSVWAGEALSVLGINSSSGKEVAPQFG
jgi:hypothetical protein